MAKDRVGKEQAKRGTDQFERQGHTAGPYGSDPQISAQGKAAQKPRELKP